MEVNGHWTYIATDWKHHTTHATLVDYGGQVVDVTIHTGTRIATQIYNLAAGREFDPGLLNIPWWLTGNSPDGYKGAINAWFL